MTRHQAFVVDTNLLVSRALIADSQPGRAVRQAMDDGNLLLSVATFAELADVLMRRKFDPYVSVESRRDYLTQINATAKWVEILRPVRACRDPKDDKFLEVAINGEADMILTGDKDLLTLHPYLGIPILSVTEFLAQTKSSL